MEQVVTEPVPVPTDAAPLVVSPVQRVVSFVLNIVTFCWIIMEITISLRYWDAAVCIDIAMPPKAWLLVTGLLSLLLWDLVRGIDTATDPFVKVLVIVMMAWSVNGFVIFMYNRDYDACKPDVLHIIFNIAVLLRISICYTIIIVTIAYYYLKNRYIR